MANLDAEAQDALLDAYNTLRLAVRGQPDDPIRMLLDGLGVASLSELHDLVERGRYWDGWRALLTEEMRFESGLVLPADTPIRVKPGPDGWALAHFRPDPYKLSRHAFALAPDQYTLLAPRR